MKKINIICTILLALILLSCNDSNNEISNELSYNCDVEEWFEDKKNGEAEKHRLEYMDRTFNYYDYNDTIDLFALYNDSIDYIINLLQKSNIDGISYSKEFLLLSKNDFLSHINNFYKAEKDGNKGTKYHSYINDQKTYEILNYYIKLKQLLPAPYSMIKPNKNQ